MASTNSQPWGTFWNSFGQNAVVKGADMFFAVQANNQGLISPETSLYSAIPDVTTQATTNSQTATGLPFRFVTESGAVNWPVVGLAGVAAMLLIKAVK